MPVWNNNDREESKPTWLTTPQKRFCVRTNRGWELPQADGIANLAGQFEGTKTLGVTANVPMMELLVCMPYNPGVTGVTSSFFANRTSPGGSLNAGVTGAGGISGDTNAPFAPYITCPFAGDSSTAGGISSLGVSHDYNTNFGVNSYGVSTLRWGVTGLGLTGGTGYIKVKANDVNFTNTLTISITGNVAGPGSANGWGGTAGIVLYTTTNLLTTSNVPAAVYDTFFGPTSAYNNDIAVIVLPKGTTSGTYGLTAQISDGSLTGTSRFSFTVL